MGLIKKSLSLLSFLIFFSLISPIYISAENDFNIDSIVKYEFNQNGEAYVTNRITLENKVSTIYAKSYTINLQNVNPKSINVVDESNNNYIFTKDDNGEYVNIKIEFPDNLVGKGAVRIFYVIYVSNAYSKKYGEIFEVNIPKISDPDNYRGYEAELIIPSFFGKKSYISPDPYKEYILNNNEIYRYDKNILSKSGVSAAFGEFQVFDFTINYHLENPLAKMGETEIALPPNTSYQRVVYEEISPKPFNIRMDPDGNWMAKYILEPRQRIDIKAKGSVKIFSKGEKQKNVNQDYLSANIVPTEFWQADNPTIKNLAVSLYTPRNIYDYVVNKLTYNYSKVQPNSERLGALSANENPGDAICMEFTDLFIALCRAAGIPAREINGYAYADNPKVQPMSLVADVLHAWPEYWDYNKGLWIPVDPTWGNTTGGEDFFSKLDLRHFTFVIHGLDSEKPYPPGSYKLGQNPERDIFVEFGKLSDYKNNDISVSTQGNNKIYFPGKKISVKIQNNNGYAVENEHAILYFDGRENYNEIIPLILPYSSYVLNIDYPYSLFGHKSPREIQIIFSGIKYKVTGIKTASIIISLLLIFSLLIFLLMICVFVSKRSVIITSLNTLFNNTFKRH